MRIKKQDIFCEVEKMPNFLDVAAKAFQVKAELANLCPTRGKIGQIS